MAKTYQIRVQIEEVDPETGEFIDVEKEETFGPYLAWDGITEIYNNVVNELSRSDNLY
jgi:hypothetical protein